MKTITTLATFAILTISTIATAMPIKPPVVKDSRILSFDVITQNADISPEHSGLFMESSLVVNYEAQTVTLNYLRSGGCKPGFSCPAVMINESIELPIVSVYSDNECSVTVIAKEDLRPVDGILRQIKIEDFSETRCEFFVKPISDFQYMTSYFDRINGKAVTSISNLKADLVEITNGLPAGEFYNLTGGEYIKGFKKNEKIASGSIAIYENTVRLEVYNLSNCSKGEMCLVSPTVIVSDFQIVSREQTGCEEVITAVDNKPGVSRQVIVKNYTKSICEIPYLHAVVAEYTSKVVAPKAKPQLARFYFDYALVKFSK